MELERVALGPGDDRGAGGDRQRPGVGLAPRPGDRSADSRAREQLAQGGKHLAVAGRVGADDALVVGEDRAQRVGQQLWEGGELDRPARGAGRRREPEQHAQLILGVAEQAEDVVGEVADRVAGNVGECLDIGQVEDRVLVVGDRDQVGGEDEGGPPAAVERQAGPQGADPQGFGRRLLEQRGCAGRVAEPAGELELWERRDPGAGPSSIRTRRASSSTRACSAPAPA